MGLAEMALVLSLYTKALAIDPSETIIREAYKALEQALPMVENVQIKRMIIKEAEARGLDPELVTDIARCESNYNPKALGDKGQSRGLWQIYRPSHDVPDEVAYDPVLSTRWATKQMAEGKYNMWSCYKLVKK